MQWAGGGPCAKRKAEAWGLHLGLSSIIKGKSLEPPVLTWRIRQSKFPETKRVPRASLRMPLVQGTGSLM